MWTFLKKKKRFVPEYGKKTVEKSIEKMNVERIIIIIVHYNIQYRSRIIM